MTFWTESTLDPVRKYRFKIITESDGELVDYWYAKSVDKPSFDINTSEYQLTNHKFKFPGVATWSDISITLVDVGGKARQTFKDSLMNQGYSFPDNTKQTERGLKKKSFNFIIEQFDSKGDPAEMWELHGAFIKSVDFGQLSYSDDELVEIKIGVAYDFATLDRYEQTIL